MYPSPPVSLLTCLSIGVVFECLLEGSDACLGARDLLLIEIAPATWTPIVPAAPAAELDERKALIFR